MRPDTPTGSIGRFADMSLIGHAQQIPDGRWAAEGWAPLPPSSQGFRGRTYQCQTCSPSKTAIKRPQITPPRMMSAGVDSSEREF